MATPTTTSGTRPSPLPPSAGRAGRAGLGGALASEFTKLRSVRSTYWTLAALVIVSVGIAAIGGAVGANALHSQPASKAGFDATQASLTGFFEFGQLTLGVLGALAITSEYSTGMIRTSLTAMPRRGTVYLAKLIVFTAVALVICVVTSFISFFLAQAMLSGTGVSASLFHSTAIPKGVYETPQTMRFVGTVLISPATVLTAVIGSALFVTVVAMIAYALGAIIRHPAGAISSVIGLMFVLPVIVLLLPDTWRWDIMRFLPDAAGQVLSVTVGQSSSHLWSAWPQFGVTLIYAAVLLALGAYLFRKRDA